MGGDKLKLVTGGFGIYTTHALVAQTWTDYGRSWIVLSKRCRSFFKTFIAEQIIRRSLATINVPALREPTGIFRDDVITTTSAADAPANVCGCKKTRACYAEMLNDLQEKDEEICIDDVELGTSTYMVYFKALQKYCGDIFNVTADYMTAEMRNLYEVNIYMKSEDAKQNQFAGDKDSVDVPILLIESGQRSGSEPLRLVLSIIERLMACEENEHMIKNLRWVILPCVNPDGLEYVRFDRPDWPKNTRKTGDGASYGVDISKNFDSHWDECEHAKNPLALKYPGPVAASEVETKFIRNTMLKYKDDIKAYVSIRRFGHAILYPHAFSDKSDDVDPRQVKVAEQISLKVNQRGGLLQAFVNDSIYRLNGKPTCGSSVDYAHNQGIPMSFEMRVGFEKDLEMLKAFQTLSSGFDSTLRTAYFSGIRELYALLTNYRGHV